MRAGNRRTPLTLDVRDVEAVKKTIAAQEPFDILVNNAGTNRPAPFVDVKVEDFDFVFGAERARRLFRGAGGGAAAGRCQRGRLHHQYVVADGPCRRGDPHGLLRDQARDGRLHQGDGDRARASQDPRQYAGADLHRDADDAAVFQNQAFREDTLARIKLGRLGQLEDLTGAIVFLASDAAALMTGTSLVVDGGWTAE